MKQVLLSLAVVALCALAAVPLSSASSRARPDLRILAIVDAPSPMLPGAQFTAGVEVGNTGRARAVASKTRYRLSRDKRAGRSDRVLGTRRTSRLRPGSSTLGMIRLEVPHGIAPGSYWLIACADATRAVRERREGNNCMVSAYEMIIEPRR
jgi:hypothetical protein